ncbi:hypothetical protein ACA910_019866 [Epithemia clementina (nom. ined.)]
MIQDPHGRANPETVLQQVAEFIQERKTNGEVVDWDVYGDFDAPISASSSSSSSSSTYSSAGNPTEKENGSFLRRFEAELSDALGMEDAVFMPSGVMAQSIALLIHRDDRHHHHGKLQAKGTNTEATDYLRPSYFICHETSHILLHEQEGYRHLLKMEPFIVSTKHKAMDTTFPFSSSSSTSTKDGNKFPSIPPMRFQDVQDLWQQQQQHYETSGIVALIVEIPHRELGGKVTSWEDLVQMRDFCRLHGVAFHCDGARIFEATTAYYFPDQKQQQRNDKNEYQNHNSDKNTSIEGTRLYNSTKTLRQLTSLFDSVYVSCYKGLGGSLSGGVLLGNAVFCQKARTWLRRFGGNLYTLLPMVMAARMGYEQEWKQSVSWAPSSSSSSSDVRAHAYDSANHGGNEDDETKHEKRLLSFPEKKEKLCRLVHRLSSEPTIAQWLAFDPPVPDTNMVHGYLRNCTVQDCMLAASKVCIVVPVVEKSGLGCKFNVVAAAVESEGNEATRHPASTSFSFPLIRRFRAVDPQHRPMAVAKGYNVMFEWTMGQANGKFHDDLYVQAWLEFCQQLSKCCGK